MKWMTALLLLPIFARAQGEIGYDRIVVVTAAVELYDGWDDLPGAKRDVALFHEVIGGPWDAPVQVIHLDDATATKDGIMEALDQAATEMGGEPNSLLIFYFAGHGETYKGKGYIVPAGGEKGRFTTWLSIDELKSASEGARAVSHQLFILGSCFGGSLITRSRERTVQELTEAETLAKWRASELKIQARAALVAGNEKQELPDGTREKGSKFGRALADALRWSAKGRAGDYNGDGCVDRYELAAYVADHGKTAHNSPRMGPLPDDGAGILALCKGRFDRPPRVVAWGARRGGGEAQALADADGDGILDVNDKCPNESEDRDAFMDHDGCSEPDNDHDGILDVDDRCPNKPETFNGIEDADGCPETK
jgi:hypothetical protein